MIKLGLTIDGKACVLNPDIDDLIGSLEDGTEYYYNKHGAVYKLHDGELHQLNSKDEIINALAEIEDIDEFTIKMICKDLA